MGRPPLDRRPNDLLAHWLTRSGLSNVQLARAVTQRATARGAKGVCPDESRVRRWLSGETPRAPVPELITEILGEHLGLGSALTVADLGFPHPQHRAAADSLDLPWQQSAATIEAIAHLTRSEVMLPHTRDTPDAHHVHSGEQLLTPLQPWATAKPSPLTERLAERAPSGRIGTLEVEGLRAITAMFRDADNRHGGVLSRKAVLAQMSDATAMLDACSYTEANGRALFSAVADLGSVAGWMSFDAGLHKSAQRLFITALHAANEGNDKAVGAHILQCMARQMSHLEHYTDALDLVALAQYGARHHASPATKSMLASLESRFHAILGNLDESERAAGHAEEAFLRIAIEDEPAHMAFFDKAELSATIGVAHQIAAKNSEGARRTRCAEKSLTMLGTALSLRPDHRVRSKAFDHLGLARTHLAVGEVEGAQQETETALILFGAINSNRVADRLVELHDEATQFAHTSAARDLRQRIEESVTVTPT
ncbi:transcriptional regulator [Streptomyces sp. NPDC059070]|uniref:transcriptional regulator n=1 Tax=Streptomyces sp. NPDC059070 TaxID=3346713 RepID=UPI0036888E32